MDKMLMKSYSNDSSRSARSTKSASASRSSSSTPKTIVKNFMKGLITTEELMKKKEYKNKGLVRLRVVLSPDDFKKNSKPKMQINKEFDAVVKGLKTANNKLLKF